MWMMPAGRSCSTANRLVILRSCISASADSASASGAIVRGEGVLLFDADGKDYLDGYNNVPVVGHSNARVREAVARQLGTLNTHTR